MYLICIVVLLTLGWRVDETQNTVYPIRKDDSLKNIDTVEKLQQSKLLLI